MTFRVRPATIADASQLSRLGATTFRDTFADANTPEDMARYLAEAFTPERQAAEIADPTGVVLLAERDGHWVLARTYAEKAKTQYEELADRANVGRLLNNLGGIEFLLGKLRETPKGNSSFFESMNT